MTSNGKIFADHFPTQVVQRAYVGITLGPLPPVQTLGYSVSSATTPTFSLESDPADGVSLSANNAEEAEAVAGGYETGAVTSSAATSTVVHDDGLGFTCATPVRNVGK